MSCPYFKEGYFGFCDAPAAIHVTTIAEMETYCFKARYRECPMFTDIMFIETSQMQRTSRAV
jgi:hypothetical protein